MLKFVNVSPSPYIWVSLIVLYFTLTICLALCRDGCCKEKGYHQTTGSQKERGGSTTPLGDGFIQPVPKKKAAGEARPSPQEAQNYPRARRGTKG